jgi:protein TonB
MHAGWLWGPLQRQPVREPTIEMKLVEPAAPAATSATREQVPPTRASAPQVPQPVVKTPQRPRLHEAATHHAVTHSVAPPSLPTTTPAPPAPRESPPESTAQPATSALAANTAAPEPHTAATASSGTGNAPARPLSQPLPDLPDDLRDVAWRTTAIARFTVHPDGSIDVELIQPTAMPRLNQLLLAALHRWRFSPAIENGRPVESGQDVRVHFNVN